MKTKNEKTNNVNKTKIVKLTNAQIQIAFDDCKSIDDKKIFVESLSKQSIDFAKIITINVNNESITIAKHRDNLITRLQKSNIAKTSSKSKSIRNQLRKTCFHFGAMRNRTYTNKLNNERIVINK